MGDTGIPITFGVTAEKWGRAVKHAFDAFTRAAMAVQPVLRDLADPPSRERRELRLIARAERAEARLWWEQHRQEARRG